MKTTEADRLFPRIEAHVQAASGQARPPRARARDPRPLGARGHVRAAAGAEPRRAEVQLRRRAGDGEQDGARSPHRLGPDAEGRLPALQGAAGARAALPERVRLPGALDRGRRRAAAGAQLEEGDRGVRPRRVRPPLPGGRRPVLARADRGLDPARAVDGLGQGLLHLQRHEHRVHLALPAARARARLALSRPPLDRVVPALRHLDLRARARRQLRRPRRPVALRAPPAARPSRRGARDLDDDPVDAARQRGRRGQARRRVRPARERRLGRGRALSGRDLRRAAAAAPSSSGSATRAPSTRSRPPRPSSTA